MHIAQLHTKGPPIVVEAPLAQRELACRTAISENPSAYRPQVVDGQLAPQTSIEHGRTICRLKVLIVQGNDLALHRGLNIDVKGPIAPAKAMRDAETKARGQNPSGAPIRL